MEVENYETYVQAVVSRLSKKFLTESKNIFPLRERDYLAK